MSEFGLYQTEDGITELAQQFFAAVPKKMHWATHCHAAAQIIHRRANASQPHMGLQYACYRRQQDALPRAVDVDFERVAKELKALPPVKRVKKSGESR